MPSNTTPPRSAIAAAMAMLVLGAGAMNVADASRRSQHAFADSAVAQQTTEPATCRWRESEKPIPADASVLDNDQYGNYGDLDDIPVGLSEDGTWRSTIRLPPLDVAESEHLMDALLRLSLATAEGDRRNTIKICRARLPWTEKGVTWRTLPPSTNPCSQTEVSKDITAYEWDVTDYVVGVRDETWEDLGLVLESLNERQKNLRRFHGRQSRDGRSQPRLVVRSLPPAEGITATAAVEAMPRGGRLRLQVRNASSGTAVHALELFNLEQSPAWNELVGLEAPEGWDYEDLSVQCEGPEGEVDSGGLRAETNRHPLAEGDGASFVVSFDSSGIPAQLVAHVSDSRGDTLGRLVIPVSAPPTETPTATASATRTPTASAQPSATTLPTGTSAATQVASPTSSATPSPTVLPTASSTTDAAQGRLFLPLLEVRRGRESGAAQVEAGPDHRGVKVKSRVIVSPASMVTSCSSVW